MCGTRSDAHSGNRAAIANEKRRRRRESHNAVERRRRDNINEKISELATLIPECLLDPNGLFPSLRLSLIPARLTLHSYDDDACVPFLCD